MTKKWGNLRRRRMSEGVECQTFHVGRCVRQFVHLRDLASAL